MKIIGIQLLLAILFNGCFIINKNQKEEKMDITLINQRVKFADSVKLGENEVWNKLIAFGGTEKFVPDLIEKVKVEGEGVGCIRTIYLKGGGEIIERLTVIDEPKKQMKFIILSTPMPVFNYEGTFTISSVSSDECFVIFESAFDVVKENKDEMKRVIKGFQKTFVSNLHK